MDSVFRQTLEQLTEANLGWSEGKLKAFGIQPCPVESLLAAYIPSWVETFLSDLWKRVSVWNIKNIKKRKHKI